LALSLAATRVALGWTRRSPALTTAVSYPHISPSCPTIHTCCHARRIRKIMREIPTLFAPRRWRLQLAALDPLRAVANDRPGATNRAVLRIWSIFLFAIQSTTSGGGFPPHPGPTTSGPQWGHRIRPARRNASPINNNGAPLRVAHSGGTIRSSKAKSGNKAANTSNATSDFFLGLSLLIEPTWFFIRHHESVWRTSRGAFTFVCLWSTRCRRSMA
jgi:hypothetical protein